MQIDYIIVGQGLCGSFLGHYLLQKGKTVLIIDNNKSDTASKIASGVINPITGRRFVRTWMIEKIMPFALEAYRSLEQQLNANIIEQCNIIDFHTTPQMKLAFEERLPQETAYLSVVKDELILKKNFNYFFGAGEINPCWLVDVNVYLDKMKLKLSTHLIETNFKIEDIEFKNNEVVYKHLTASKIIFCDGINGFENVWFKMLPFSPNKGEALLVEIPNLPRTNIYKSGLSIVPWRDDLFWVGSSYEWSFNTIEPTEIFRKKTEFSLNQLLKHPYKIVNHLAAVRPANIERRPFVGLHPMNQQIGIFNGMGTKGCSLAPYFANEFANHLVNNTPLNPLIDIKRFERVLSK